MHTIKGSGNMVFLMVLEDCIMIMGHFFKDFFKKISQNVQMDYLFILMELVIKDRFRIRKPMVRAYLFPKR
jgi:hypothetical protein